MATGGNISSGIGTGAAQIIQPWNNPITPQLQFQAQQVEDAKQAKKEKEALDVMGSLKDFQFKGLNNHAPLFIAEYNKIIDDAANQLRAGDPMAAMNARQAINNLASKMQASVDLKSDIESLYDNYNKNYTKQDFIGIDEAITEATKDISPEEFADPVKFANAMAARIKAIKGVQAIDKYDELQAKKDALELFKTQAAFNDIQGVQQYSLENAKSDVPMILGSPKNLGAATYYKNLLAQSPDLQATYKDDWQALAKDRLAEEYTKIPKPTKDTNINITNMPEESATGVGRIFKNTSFVIGDPKDKGQFEYVMDGFSVSPKETVTAVPSNAWNMTTLDRPTQTGGINLKNGQLARGKVTNRDITIPAGFGKFSGITIPAGMPIPQKSKDGFLNPVIDYLNKSKDVGYGTFFMGQDASNDDWIAMPSDIGMGAVESGLTKQGGTIFYDRVKELEGLNSQPSIQKTNTQKTSTQSGFSGLPGFKKNK